MSRQFMALAVLAASLACGAARPTLALDCNPETPKSSDFRVDISRATAWQPRGGQAKVVIETATDTVKNLSVVACFRWSGHENGAWESSPLVQLAEMTGDTPKKAVWAVTVPASGVKGTPTVPASGLVRLRSDWWDRLWLGRDGIATDYGDDALDYDAARAVPVADLKIIVTKNETGKPATVVAVETRPLGITSLWTAAILTAVCVAVGLLLLRVWARARRVPGDGLLLPIITARDGSASLSQFQIMMWTLLFAAGAIYVMGLSGSLIDIPEGALVLLGISGLATVGTKVKEASAPKPPAPPAPPPSTATVRPGAVGGFTIANVTDNGVTLSWTAPTLVAGADVQAYIVSYTRAGFADWKVAGGAVQANQFNVVGLLSDTEYRFSVAASNAAGQGPPAEGAARTRQRVPITTRPSWSDLVGTAEHPGEIDVTRVQMLVFTLVAAGFVAIKLFNSYTIPEIPSGILILMGISNGTYLGAKFADR
jgi:hypothetical protein